MIFNSEVFILVRIEHKTVYGYRYKFDASIEAKLEFRLFTNGSEEVFEVRVNNDISELGRRSFQGIFNWLRIKENIREIVIEEIYKNSNQQPTTTQPNNLAIKKTESMDYFFSEPQILTNL